MIALVAIGNLIMMLMQTFYASIFELALPVLLVNIFFNRVCDDWVSASIKSLLCLVVAIVRLAESFARRRNSGVRLVLLFFQAFLIYTVLGSILVSLFSSCCFSFVPYYDLEWSYTRKHPNIWRCVRPHLHYFLLDALLIGGIIAQNQSTFIFELFLITYGLIFSQCLLPHFANKALGHAGRTNVQHIKIWSSTNNLSIPPPRLHVLLYLYILSISQQDVPSSSIPLIQSRYRMYNEFLIRLNITPLSDRITLFHKLYDSHPLLVESEVGKCFSRINKESLLSECKTTEERDFIMRMTD